MKLVVIESPYKHPDHDEVEVNRVYARLALRHSLEKGEAPYASHLLLTQVTDEETEERDWGIKAGFAWGAKADYVAIYCDLGITPGMIWGFKEAHKRGQRVELRQLQSKMDLSFLGTSRLIPGWERCLAEAKVKLGFSGKLS